MRYFSHFIIAIVLLAVIVFAFFLFSLGYKKSAEFTDSEKPTSPTVTIVDPSRGSKTAAVTIVNFGDYQCDSCATAEVALEAVTKEFGDNVRVVWKDMPNDSLHSEAINAAIAARCAGEQGRFWDFHDALFANQEAISASIYGEIAKALDLKTGPFTTCYEKQETLPLVQKTYDEGVALGITTTPTIYINGVRYTGVIDAAALKTFIRPQISRM